MGLFSSDVGGTPRRKEKKYKSESKVFRLNKYTWQELEELLNKEWEIVDNYRVPTFGDEELFLILHRLEEIKQ